VVGVAVYLVALSTHEVMHLVALYAMGRAGVLIVHGYRFTFLPLTIDSFHAQASAPLDFTSHLLFDFAGPALAMILIGLLAWVVRGRVASAMLLANLAVLGFYAVIEPLDVLFDAAGVNAPFLLWAEFNYGVPLAVLLVTSIVVSRRAPG
jgi:hypothetical protein